MIRIHPLYVLPVIFLVIFLIGLGFRPDGLPFLVSAGRGNDATGLHWPSALYLKQSIERGDYPLWRDTIMLDEPFAANPLNKTGYPLQWLVLFLPPSLHLNVMIILHVCLAGIGMCLWARKRGLRTEAGIVGAVAYMFTPYTTFVMAGQFDIVYAMGWFPWLMWSLCDAPQPGRTPLISILRTALIATMLCMADLRISLFAFLIGTAYEGFYLLRLRRWHQVGHRLGSVAVFWSLVAVLIVPITLWSPYVNRADLTVADAGYLSLPPEMLLQVGVYVPNVGLTYLGLATVLLVLIGFATMPRREMLFWSIMALFVILFALGTNTPFWPKLVEVFPSLLWFRVPNRWWFGIALIVSLLAAYGAQALILLAEQLVRREESRHLERWQLLGWLLPVTIIFGTGALLMAALPAMTWILFLVVGSLLSTVVLLMVYNRVTPAWFIYALLVIVFVDLAWVASSRVQWRGPDQWYTPWVALAERLKQEDPARIYAPAYSLPQHVAQVYGYRLFGGGDPFQLKGIQKVLEAGSGWEYGQYNVGLPAFPILTGAETPDQIVWFVTDSVINTQVLAEWDVSHVVATYPIDNPRLSFVAKIGYVSIYRNEDYSPRPTTPRTPNWPDGYQARWPELPAPAEIERIDRLTLISAAVSGISFIGCTLLLTILIIRDRRRTLQSDAARVQPRLGTE
jgi:hypothetical protein